MNKFVTTFNEEKEDVVHSLFEGFSKVQNSEEFLSFILVRRPDLTNPEKVFRILANPFYAGHFETKNGYQKLTYVTPIIDLDLFQKCKDKLDEYYSYYQKALGDILSYIGIRVGELVALNWKDIDFENQTISISKTYYNPNNNTVQFQLVTPKTKKSRRKIVVDEDVIKALRLHKDTQAKIIQQVGDAYNTIIKTSSLLKQRDIQDILL